MSDNPETQAQIDEILRKSNSKYAHDLDIASQSKCMQEVLSHEEDYRIIVLTQSVLTAIKAVDKRATDEEITAVCKEIIKDLPPEKRTCETVAPLVNERLQLRKKQTVKRERTVSSQDMLNSILEN